MQDYDSTVFLCHVYPWLGTLHLGEFRATSAVLCEEKLIMEPVRVQVITIFVEKRNNSVRGNVAVIL